MSIQQSARRTVVVLCATLAIGAAIVAQSAFAQSGFRVDVSPLRANAGDQTASWVQRDLSAQLAQALAGRNVRNGAALIVRIDYLTLSSGARVDCGSSRDTISGVAIIGGVQTPVQATTSYQPAPSDSTMIEQSNRERVSQLVQALVFWLSRDL